MDRNEALKEIEKYISEADSPIKLGIAVGFISACCRFGLIEINEMSDLHNRAFGLSKDDHK